MVIGMGFISEYRQKPPFHGEIPYWLLSSMGSNTAVYLYTPQKSWAGFWPEFCWFLTKHRFSIERKAKETCR